MPAPPSVGVMDKIVDLVQRRMDRYNALSMADDAVGGLDAIALWSEWEQRAAAKEEPYASLVRRVQLAEHEEIPTELISIPDGHGIRDGQIAHSPDWEHWLEKVDLVLPEEYVWLSLNVDPNPGTSEIKTDLGRIRARNLHRFDERLAQLRGLRVEAQYYEEFYAVALAGLGAAAAPPEACRQVDRRRDQQGPERRGLEIARRQGTRSRGEHCEKTFRTALCEGEGVADVPGGNRMAHPQKARAQQD